MVFLNVFILTKEHNSLQNFGRNYQDYLGLELGLVRISSQAQGIVERMNAVVGQLLRYKLVGMNDKNIRLKFCQLLN